MAVTNNVPHTSYTVDEGMFGGGEVTLTAESGYVFDGTPTVTYTDNQFGEEHTVNMTINSTNAYAHYENDEMDVSKNVIFNGNTKVFEAVFTNNVPNTTATVANGLVTVTCNSGYKFTAAPVISFDDDPFAEEITMTLNDTSTVATYSQTGIEKQVITITGNTVQDEPQPVEPVVVNNVPNTTETHSYEGTSVTINLASELYLMKNVRVACTGTDSTAKTVDVVVTPQIKPERVVSTATVTIENVDFTQQITVTGETVVARPVEWSLSGCSSDSMPQWIENGGTLSVTLTADEGNEFNDPSKNFIEPQGAMSEGQVRLTISENKKTATGSYTLQAVDDGIVVSGEANPVVVPTKKYGFINAYVVSEDVMETFAAKRFINTGTEYQDTDLGDFVSRVKRYFFEVEKGSTSNLKCGNYTVEVQVNNIASDRKVISFGAVEIPNYTQSAADYQSDVTMFVPFLGLVNVSSEIIGKTVELRLSVNILSGGGVYTLTCEDRLIWSQEVKPCTDVIYRTSTEDEKTVGGYNFDSTFLMGLEPYILVEKKEIVNTGSQSTSDLVSRIGDLTGNVKLTDVVFTDTSNMLQSDIDEIISTLRLGVSL